MMFSNKYRYLFIIGLALYAYSITVLCDVYLYFNISIDWYWALTTILAITFFSWEGNRLIEKAFQRSNIRWRNKFFFIATFFSSGLVLSMLASFATVWLVGQKIYNNTWAQNLMPQKLNLIYAGLINLLFHLLNTILLFFHEYKKQWNEAEQLRRLSMQSQIQLIRNQVNPHFLFNNLNVLSSLLIKTNPEANEFIEEFAKVYRYILNSHDKELVELSKELEFIDPYLFLLKKRFEDGLQVQVDVPENFRRTYIIPVALQMLIENAIKHNVVSKNAPLKISVVIQDGDTITIKNNLQPKTSSEPSTNIGLFNIVKRYELICDERVRIVKNENEFIVQLPLLFLN